MLALVSVLAAAPSAPVVKVHVTTAPSLSGGTLYLRKAQGAWQDMGTIPDAGREFDLIDLQTYEIQVERETFFEVFSGRVTYTPNQVRRDPNLEKRALRVSVEADPPRFNVAGVALKLGLPLVLGLVAIPWVLLVRSSRRRQQAEEEANMERAKMAQLASSLAETHVPLPASMTVQGYEIEDVLGEGGMASVFRVKGPDGAWYALKIPNVEALRDDEFVQRFRREMQICGELNHPNIVRIFEKGTFVSADGEDVPFMIMELLRGQNLAEVLESEYRDAGVPDPGFAVWVAREVASALQAAHEKGVIHRDIKPSNIMLTTDAQVKVMDFGIARSSRSSNLTETKAALGTPVYMAPEQVVSTRKVDHRADIYALGVVLYSMLTYQLPYDDDDMQQLLMNKFQGDITPPSMLFPHIPSVLDDIVRTLMHQDPNQRCQSAREVMELLDACGVVPTPMDVEETKRIRVDQVQTAKAGPPQPS